MAQYVDYCPSNKTTVCYRRGGNFCLDITTLLSLKTTLARSFNQIYLSFVFYQELLHRVYNLK